MQALTTFSTELCMDYDIDMDGKIGAYGWKGQCSS